MYTPSLAPWGNRGSGRRSNGRGRFAVARKQRLRTRAGTPYLALELVDASGRIDSSGLDDVELLDARFAEGDAIRVLGRVERFRDKLQLGIRSLEPAAEADPAELSPALRRDPEELDGFLEFLAGELTIRASPRPFRDPRRHGRSAPRSAPLPAAPHGHHGYAGGLLEHTVGVHALPRGCAAPSAPARATLLVGRGAPPRSRPHPRAGPRADLTADAEGQLLGHVHLGLRVIEERATELDVQTQRRTAPLPSPSTTTCAARRTAEAAGLYHANQLARAGRHAAWFLGGAPPRQR